MESNVRYKLYIYQENGKPVLSRDCALFVVADDKEHFLKGVQSFSITIDKNSVTPLFTLRISVDTKLEINGKEVNGRDICIDTLSIPEIVYCASPFWRISD